MGERCFGLPQGVSWSWANEETGLVGVTTGGNRAGHNTLGNEAETAQFSGPRCPRPLTWCPLDLPFEFTNHIGNKKSTRQPAISCCILSRPDRAGFPLPWARTPEGGHIRDRWLWSRWKGNPGSQAPLSPGPLPPCPGPGVRDPWGPFTWWPGGRTAPRSRAACCWVGRRARKRGSELVIKNGNLW